MAYFALTFQLMAISVSLVMIILKKSLDRRCLLSLLMDK